MSASLDVSAWIDRARMSSLQWRVFVLCFLMAAVEGYDAQVIGYVAPAVIKSFQVPPPAMAIVFASGLVGLMLGCLLIAPLADRFGRKHVMVASALVFGVMSLLTTQAGSLNGLMWLRFLTGLGLGGAMPNSIALTAEYLPARHRAALTMAMFVGFPFGATIGGLIAAPLIPAYGWPVVFWIGGALPLVLAVVLALALPESTRYLVARRADPARIRAILRQIDPVMAPGDDVGFSVQEEQAEGLTVAHLFSGGRAMGTVLLWVMFFMSLLDIFFLASWLPTVMHAAGLTLATAVVAGATVQGGGVVTALLVGRWIDRTGFFVVLVPLYLVATIAIAWLGQPGQSVTMVMIAAFFSGAGIVGGQTAINVLAAVYYPTFMRATGVGWGLGIGRIGSIVGPVIGGMLISWQWSNQALFIAAAIPALVTVLAAALMARTDGRRVAELQNSGVA